MALDPRIDRDASGTFWLRWTPDTTAEGYAFVTPGGASRSFDATKKEAKLGKNLTEPVVASVSALDVTTRAAETATYPPPPPPPPPPAISPPVAPITTVTNAPGLGKNVTTRQDIQDLIVDGCGDTGVLFQMASGGSTLKRARLLRVAAGNSVPYGKHAIYGKAANLTVEDLVAECSPHCASGLSMRYDGATVRRFSVKGAPHAISYYETSATVGTVLFEDGNCSFTGDTGVWIDAETDYQPRVVQSFVFRRIAMNGPGVFLKVAASRFAGKVRAEGCTLNGRPVTSADFPGVPYLTIA